VIVAVASGKGGTGKTTVAAALSRVWDGPRIAVDMDVEAPNLHLFLHPRLTGEARASLEVPVANPDLCDGCGACADFCAFKAIAVFSDFPVVFPEMCHGCGGCLAVCPRGALTAGERVLGEIAWGAVDGGIAFLMGRLRIGEAMSPPLMGAVRRRLRTMLAEHPVDVLVDAPPGTSCPAIEAVRDADIVVLVTEPTPFGLYDLDLAYRAFGSLGKPMAVVVNRAGRGDKKIEMFCHERDLPILDAIPFERAVAEAYARGIPLDAVSFSHKARIQRLAENIRAFAKDCRIAEAFCA
jgi:MinD superfamily P-loop ATPase